MIPDGALVEKDSEVWVDALLKSLRRIGFKLTEYRLTEVNNKDHSSLLSFDAVFILGGSSKYLINLYQETGFDVFLPKLFAAGVTYIGSSASGMILSPTLDTSDWYIGEEEPGAKTIKGLGLIPFQVYPHYNEENLSEIKKKRDPNLTYILLKDGEAFSVRDNILNFYGNKVSFLVPIYKQ